MATAKNENIKTKAAAVKTNAIAAFTVALALAFLTAAMSLAGYVHLNVVANEALASLIGLVGIWKLLKNVR